jgi:riboflavin kinase
MFTSMSKHRLILKGKVASGLGQGRFYLAKRQYQQNIKRILGYCPFFGTLNIKLTNPQSQRRLNKFVPIRVKDFQESNKKFAALKCYPCLLFFKKLSNIKAHIIVPQVNKKPDGIIELIAPFSLRNKYNLRDGEEVKILLSIF